MIMKKRKRNEEVNLSSASSGMSRSPSVAQSPDDKKMMPRHVEPPAVLRSPLIEIKSALFIPQALWILTAGFLNKTDLASLTLVNTTFVFVYMECKRISYRREFPGFDLYSRKYPNDTLPTQLRLFNGMITEFDSFFTLIDRSYIPLFSALKKYDQDEAIKFISSKLLTTQDSEENVTDMVFFQKVRNGETAITLALRLGLQDFLDFCFKELILNGQVLNQKKYSLIKTGKLDAILGDNQMQTEILWMYACAYICNQTDVCHKILEKPFWDKTFSEGEKETLSLIAALLSSQDLLVYALDGISGDSLYGQMHLPIHFDRGQIYCNDLRIRGTPLNIAIMSNNVEMIKYLLPRTRSTVDQSDDDWNEMSCYQAPLLVFYIQQRNLAELKNCLSDTDGRMLVKPVGISPKYFGIDLPVKLARKYNVLDLVLANQWARGADLLLAHAAALAGRTPPDGMSVIHAADTGNLRILKLLVAHQVSLSIKYPLPESWGSDRSEYPLITALWKEENGGNDTISSYIIEKIGSKAAVEQISEEIQNPRVEGSDVESFKILKEELIEEMAEETEEEAEEEAEETPRLSATNLSILSGGQNNRQDTPEANIPKLGQGQ
jgi:hypothetical protein